MTLHKITDSCTEWFRVCPNITLKFRSIAIFKAFIKQSNDLNKIFSYLHGLSLYQTLFILSATIHELSPENKILIITFKRPPRSYFVSSKNGLLKVV
jgi:hypothetical protein